MDDKRIAELIARAGSPAKIEKEEKQYSASARMAKIDKQARMMAHQLNSPKYECTISIMGDEIIAQDAKIRDLENTIARMEAALHHVLNQREQLKLDLCEAATRDCLFGACIYCDHINVECHNEPCKTCMAGRERPNFEWRGVLDEDGEEY